MNSKVSKELRRISKRVFKEHGKGLMVKKESYPTISKVVDLALKDDSVSPQKKERLQRIKESGKLNETHEEVDPKVEKKLSKEMEKEIKRAIKLGRLPKAEEDKELQAYIKKAEKNAKKLKGTSK